MPRHSLLLAVAATGLFPATAASASDQAITSALGRAVQQCWIPRQDADGSAVVRLRIAPDGSLLGEPELDGGGEATDPLAASALRAVRACAPYPGVGELIGEESAEIRATFSLAGFSAVKAEDATQDIAEDVTIQASDDIVLHVPEPEGLCYVDPEGGGLQSQYIELMSSTLAGNHVHGFFLDCETVRQLEAGEVDFTLPKRAMTVFSPLADDGSVQRFPWRSQEQAVAFYEDFFERQGAPGSALERSSRAVEDRLNEDWDIAIESGRQVVEAVDERAAYTTMFSNAETETGTLRQMSVGSYGQVFDLPVILSLYAPYEDGGIDALLAEAQKLVAAMHANSVRKD